MEELKAVRFQIDQYQEMAENNNCFPLQDPCFPSIL
jgi:hypothetical protein